MESPDGIFWKPLHYPRLPPGPPILDAACKCDATRVARLLDENPALVNSRHEAAEQPLHVAAEWGCGKVVELLLDRGAEIDAHGRHGMTPLHLAAENAKPRVARLLLRRGANPYLLDVFGFTPLVSAARRFDEQGYKAARTMIRAGAKCDLHAAVCLGDLAMVESLLRDAPDVRRSYPIPGDLLFDGLLMVLSRVVDYDASPDNLDQSIRDFGPICRLLVLHGVSPNESSRWSGPPLHDNLGEKSLARFLIDLGADVNLVGTSGERPLEIAERVGYTTVVQVLKEHGAF